MKALWNKPLKLFAIQIFSDREIALKIKPLLRKGYREMWHVSTCISARPLTELIATAKLPYLSAVCHETLRINPPALSTFARTVKKPIEIDRYYLEPGTEIDVSIYLAHRRKAVDPEPNKFRPERFLERQCLGERSLAPRGGAGSHRYSSYEFLPFGGGNAVVLVLV